GGRRARARSRRQARRADPYLRRAGRALGPARRGGGIRRSRRNRQRRRRLPALVASVAMPRERDLFANFERMRREIDELFGDVFERTGFGPGRAFSPEVDVYYTGQPARAVVKADLAGVDIDDVALEIRGRQLVIAGERRAADA